MNSWRMIVGVALVTSVSAHAQWLNYPTAGVPRLPDGKPNLSAPAPRTADGKPDLSGIWQLEARCPPDGCNDYAPAPEFLDFGARLEGGLPYQPWAADLVKERHPHLSAAEEVHPTPRSGRHSVGARRHVPAALRGWAAITQGSGAVVERVFYREVGGRHVRGRNHRSSRRDLARSQRESDDGRRQS